MRTQDSDTLVRRFLDGDLSPAEEAEALHCIAEAPTARALLRFDRHLFEALGPTRPPAGIPDDFTDRVLHALAAQPDRPSPPTSGHPGRRPVQRPRLSRLRAFAGRPAYALLIVAVLALAFFAGRESRIGPPVPPETADLALAENASAETVWVRFLYLDDAASSVAIAGDFSNWEPIPLTARQTDGATAWTIMLPLTPDEHRYLFVVDETRWVPDPLAPFSRDDGFGQVNSVIPL